MDELEQLAFELFAEIYPHEAYEMYPEKFWRLFHSRCPNLSHEQMEMLLANS